ncbi:MAG: peptide synthetase [Micromonosporaceae bacterium]|nr:peptide synthetase [Micromonosporaceae bacterium]
MRALRGTAGGGRYPVAEEVEDWLGDPEVAANTVSFSRALELDEREVLPDEAIARLRQFGFRRYFVPVTHGGNLRSCEELAMMARVVARRDMNVAVSESTQLWLMLVWIGGNPGQCREIADAALRGEVVPCLAYSEAEHGADLVANDFVAVPGDGDYVLSGTKWPINRAVTSTHLVLLARTHADGAADGVPPARTQSLFLVDKERVSSGEVSGLPRVPTYGLRGCDISGVRFREARVPSAARLGADGEGLELALRGLLLTRTLCTALSLGVGDTMLRVVSGFLARRMLYGGPTSEIPYVTESLAGAYLNLLIAECESIVATRGLHLYADEFSSWANLAKVGVARLVDYGGTVLARTLGARYYLRAEEHQGIFQKMLRDGAIVSVFDGSEPVCLDSIALQLASMAKARRRPRDDDWRALYDLREPLPDFDPTRVEVFGRGRDATFASLPALRARLEGLAPSPECGDERLAALRGLAARLQRDVDSLFARAGEARRAPDGAAGPARAPSSTMATSTTWATSSTKTTSPRLIRLAEECCDLHAKVACLGMWLFNRDHLDVFFAGGEWLEAALGRPSGHRFDVGDLSPPAASRLVARLDAQRDNREFFSIVPIRQAAPGSRERRLVPEPV